jgi:hypothetical protein
MWCQQPSCHAVCVQVCCAACMPMRVSTVAGCVPQMTTAFLLALLSNLLPLWRCTPSRCVTTTTCGADGTLHSRSQTQLRRLHRRRPHSRRNPASSPAGSVPADLEKACTGIHLCRRKWRAAGSRSESGRLSCKAGQTFQDHQTGSSDSVVPKDSTRYAAVSMLFHSVTQMAAVAVAARPPPVRRGHLGGAGRSGQQRRGGSGSGHGCRGAAPVDATQFPGHALCPPRRQQHRPGSRWCYCFRSRATASTITDCVTCRMAHLPVVRSASSLHDVNVRRCFP